MEAQAPTIPTSPIAIQAKRQVGAAPAPTTSGAIAPERATPIAPPAQIAPEARPRSSGITRSSVREIVRTVATAAQMPTASRQRPSWTRFALAADPIIVAPVASNATVLSRTRSRCARRPPGRAACRGDSRRGSHSRPGRRRDTSRSGRRAGRAAAGHRRAGQAEEHTEGQRGPGGERAVGSAMVGRGGCASGSAGAVQIDHASLRCSTTARAMIFCPARLG